jgi:hypothetical protein
MRFDIILFTSLAGLVFSYPAEVVIQRRTSGLLTHSIGDAASNVTGSADSVITVSVNSSTTVLAGLSAHGAAALMGGALGCTAGVIQVDARAELQGWLASQTGISESLKNSLTAWCEGSGSATLTTDAIAALSVYIPTCADIAAKKSIYVTIDGIFSSTELSSTLVLSASAQASLSTFLDIHAHVDLGTHIHAGLSVCAAGGVISSLKADVKASLVAWLTSSECALDGALKASILGWCHSIHVSGLVEIGSIASTALSAISVGASIGTYVEEVGALSVHAQAVLTAFLNTKLAVDIETDILIALQACAAGKLAAVLDVDVHNALAVWLTGSSCPLGVEMKGAVFLWLSASASAEASLALVKDFFVDISGFLTNNIIPSLSANLRSAFGLFISGESVAVLSWDARAEFAAFLGGCTEIEISVNIQLIITKWFTGCSIPGAPVPSASLSSLPSSTPTGVSRTNLVPSGFVITTPVPSRSVLSSTIHTGLTDSISTSVPPGPTSTGTAGGKDASPTACNTLNPPANASAVVVAGPSESAPTGSSQAVSGSTCSDTSRVSSTVIAPAPTTAPIASVSGWLSSSWTETVTIYNTIYACE